MEAQRVEHLVWPPRRLRRFVKGTKTRPEGSDASADMRDAVRRQRMTILNPNRGREASSLHPGVNQPLQSPVCRIGGVCAFRRFPTAVRVESGRRSERIRTAFSLKADGGSAAGAATSSGVDEGQGWPVITSFAKGSLSHRVVVGAVGMWAGRRAVQGPGAGWERERGRGVGCRQPVYGPSFPRRSQGCHKPWRPASGPQRRSCGHAFGRSEPFTSFSVDCAPPSPVPGPLQVPDGGESRP
jgi:hypothetical protein